MHAKNVVVSKVAKIKSKKKRKINNVCKSEKKEKKKSSVEEELLSKHKENMKELKQIIENLQLRVRVLENKIRKPRIVENKELAVYCSLIGKGSVHKCFKEIDWVDLKL